MPQYPKITIQDIYYHIFDYIARVLWQISAFLHRNSTPSIRDVTKFLRLLHVDKLQKNGNVVKHVTLKRDQRILCLSGCGRCPHGQSMMVDGETISDVDKYVRR